MYGIENVGLATPIFSEKANHFFIEVELGLPVVAEVLKAKTADVHGVIIASCKLRGIGLRLQASRPWLYLIAYYSGEALYISKLA
jgi:hypothetical protein